MLSLEVEKEEDGLGPVGAEIVDAGARLEIVDVVGVEVLDQARLGALLHAAHAAQSHDESELDGRVQLVHALNIRIGELLHNLVLMQPKHVLRYRVLVQLIGRLTARQVLAHLAAQTRLAAALASAGSTSSSSRLELVHVEGARDLEVDRVQVGLDQHPHLVEAGRVPLLGYLQDVPRLADLRLVRLVHKAGDAAARMRARLLAAAATASRRAGESASGHRASACAMLELQ